MLKAVGLFSLDGAELDEIELAENVVVKSFQSSTAPPGMRYFALLCFRPGRSSTRIKSPPIFYTDGEAIGYGRATLEAARRQLEQLKARNAQD